MTVLALDTTSRCASLSLLAGDTILLEYNFSSTGSLSALLLPSLEFLLRTQKLSFADVGLIGVGVGPGLFTGIRVGLAAVKGLLAAAPKPVVPVVTLRALACKLSESPRAVVPLVDVRRGEVAGAVYRHDAGGMREQIAPFLSPLGGLDGLLAGCGAPAFVGSGAEAHREALKRAFPGCAIYYRSHFLASEIGRIAAAEHRSGRSLTDLQQLLPIYVRRPDAELGRADAHAGESAHPPR